jgi:hypothetical protein
MNNRKAIRAKVKELLTKQVANVYPTMAGNRVFSRQVGRGDEEECPYINFSLKEENLEKFEQSPRTKSRKLTLKIECVVSKDTDTDDLEDKCDDFCEQVENIFNNNRFLDDLVEDTDETSIDSDISQEGEDPIAGILLTYSINYITNEDPAYDLGDFLTINQKIQAGENIIESEINLPQ